MIINDRGFGLLPTIPDERDYTASNFGIEPQQVEHIELDLPNFIYDQGRSLMCGANSASLMLSILNKTNVKFSRAFIYQHKRNAGEGAGVRDMMSVLFNHGACLESVFEKTGTLEECRTAYLMHKDAAEFVSELGRIKHYYKVETPEDVVAALKNGTPVLAGVQVYSNFIPDFEGHVPQPSGKYIGGHMIAITGCKERYFKITSSYGKSWGIDGSAWVPMDMVESMYAATDASMKLTKVYFKIGQDYYIKNGVRVNMPEAPKLEDGKTWIPLREVAESLDCNVKWYAASEGIGITR